ncbi:MAG: hypothetical protein QOI80_3634 [Solirubrobacteraceae bacterium]|nr:hypothetical protein [Solirubrobacteraceae bacterium]
MLLRILQKALIAVGVYVALLSPVGALAQDPTPDASSTATEAPTEAPTQAPTQAPTEAPTQAPTQSPTETATASPTEAATTTPVASPEATATAQPSPTPTPEADEKGPSGFDQAGADVDEAGAKTIKGCDAVPRRRNGHKLSPSTIARECARLERERAARRHQRAEDRPGVPVAPDGTPTISNPALSVAIPGAAPIGVPNFFIDKFRIPPFLLPIYQAAGVEYGIRWEVLAAINEIETDYGRNLNVSSAGAVGWMQFMPATWRMYGVDANRDGVKDPFNPVDAIFAAARYLKAAGAEKDLRRGIFAYNHADWYVDSVLLRARMIGGLPADFVGSLTGLTQARFPVDAQARYAGQVDTKTKRIREGNVALPVESDATRHDIDIFAKNGSPVIAVNDGRVTGLGQDEERGRWIRLRDVYGNTFTYSHLGSVARTYPAPRERTVTKAQVRRELDLPGADPKPTRAASSTKRKATRRPAAKPKHQPKAAPVASEPVAITKDRLFAHPHRPRARAAGGDIQLAQDDYTPQAGAALKLNPADYVPQRMRKGARIISGTILGHIGKTSQTVAPHVRFAIKPAGRGAPEIDPKPILDGWKLLETTALYRAAGKNPLVGPDAEQPSIGQILLMSKAALQEHVLANPRIDLYECGRDDVRLGLVDRRVLATLEFLSASGLKPSVSSLRCGHGYLTASGNVSEHSSGNAVDIAAVNGIPIYGHQGPGSITEMTIERLLTLQGTMKPHQIISLMTFQNADNTLALPDHADHIHVGFHPLYGSSSTADKQASSVLRPRQWIKLIDRLSEIDNPVVAAEPSKYALRVARSGAPAD